MKQPRCPYCGGQARLVGGQEIYPQRLDLHALKFWQCAPCDAYVGCHKMDARVDGVVSDGTIPLGRLANAELRKAKSRAHAAFDPLWKSRAMTRRQAYAWLADGLGINKSSCHIGMMDVAQCNAVVEFIRSKRR